MSDAETVVEPVPPDPVEEYRLERFERMGLDTKNAAAAAVLRDVEHGSYRVDLHVFEAMTAAGCSPAVALLILV